MTLAYTNTKGGIYYLHQVLTTLKNGQHSTLYFFAKMVKEGALDEVPEGYQIVESKTGMPVLKKA